MRGRDVEAADARRWNFQDVYDEFQPRIHRFLSRLLGTRDVEDLTQEAFIKISQALPEFRGECTLSTWVYRIARNVAVDRWRDLSGQRESEARLRSQLPAIASSPDVEQQLVRREMADCIGQYVDRLPASYRSVVILREEEGLTNREIAEILGISLNTVKIRLHRARRRLERELGRGCRVYRDSRNELACEPMPVVYPLVTDLRL